MGIKITGLDKVLENIKKIHQVTNSNDSNQKSHSVESFDIDDYIYDNSGIFDRDNIPLNQFGGNQGNLVKNIESYIDNDNVWEIVEKYYPDVTEEDLELLFNRMNFVGCGYVAALNTFLQYASLYMSEIEFYEKFGFNLFDLQYDNEGKLIPDYNYDLLFLDFFLYYAKNNRGFETIEEVYGNVEEEMQFRDSDAALDDIKFDRTGMIGTYTDIVGSVLKDYLSDYGIEVELSEKIVAEPGTEIWNILKEKLEVKGVNVKDDQVLYENNPSIDAIKEIIKSGKNIVISASDFDLYSIEDKDGNGQLDDIVQEDVGAHAMMVVNVTDDGRYIVSSWGKIYLYDPENDLINDYAIYDYHD